MLDAGCSQYVAGAASAANSEGFDFVAAALAANGPGFDFVAAALAAISRVIATEVAPAGHSCEHYHRHELDDS